MEYSMRIPILALFGVAIAQSACYSATSATRRVIVELSGQFSSNPNDIVVNGNPGSFPLPSLLGGSFAGSFEYRIDAVSVGPAPGPKQFPLSATSIDVFDNTGNSIYTITLPSIYANQLIIWNGEATIRLGPSGPIAGAGYLPRMPTDIRFHLISGEFSSANDAPPVAAVLNSASVLSAEIPFGPFVELDDAINYFDGWDLPITDLSLVAREVPEPSSLAIAFLGIIGLTLLRPHTGKPAAEGV
jgi:hypothetical protein